MAAETKRERAGTIVRAFQAADAAAVAAILKESPQAADWTEASLRVSAEWRGVVALVSESEGSVSGFIIGRQVGDEAEILILAVNPARRRRGEGGSLLRAALEEFQARNVVSVFLEVRDSNQDAIAFYSKHGFSERDVRLKYYRDPEESAVVMEKKITG